MYIERSEEETQPKAFEEGSSHLTDSHFVT